MKTIAPLLLAALPLLACATVGFDYAKEPDPRKGAYVIGPTDRLRVWVWKSPELTTDTVVRPDGKITMPLIGEVQAKGRTASELRTEISQRLATFVKDESMVVTVEVAEAVSYRFTVDGNVEHSGAFAPKYYVTVREAIAMAGGFNRFAAPRSMVLVRTDADGKVRRIPINFDRITDGKRPESNLVLLAGDVLYVP